MYFTQLKYQKPESIFLLLQTSVGFKTPCACSLVHLLAPLGNHLIKGISAPEHLAAASTAANLVKFVYRVWEIHFQVFHLSDFESLHFVTGGIVRSHRKSNRKQGAELGALKPQLSCRLSIFS